jgi:hypothetical protein
MARSNSHAVQPHAKGTTRATKKSRVGYSKIKPGVGAVNIGVFAHFDTGRLASDIGLQDADHDTVERRLRALTRDNCAEVLWAVFDGRGQPVVVRDSEPAGPVSDGSRRLARIQRTGYSFA